MRKYLLVLLCFLSVSGYTATLEPYRVIPSFTGPSYEGKEVTHQTQFKIQIVRAIEFVSYTTNMSGVSKYGFFTYTFPVVLTGNYVVNGNLMGKAIYETATSSVTYYMCPDTSKCEKWKCPACNNDFCGVHQNHAVFGGGKIASNCTVDHPACCAETEAEAKTKWDNFVSNSINYCATCETLYCGLCPHKCNTPGCDIECTKKNCPVCGITYCPTHDGEPIITICPDCEQQKCNHQAHTCPDPENPDPENPDPENPDPENPDPENPDPENPNPENPNPVPDPPSDYTDILDALNGINDKLNEQNKKIDEIKEDVSDILESLTKSGTYSTPDGLEEQKIGDLPDNTESDKPFGIGDGQGLTDGLKDVGGLGNIDSFSPSSGGDWIITFPLSLVGFGLEDVTFNVTQNLTDLYSPLRSVFSVIVWLWGTYMGYGILRDGLTLAG